MSSGVEILNVSTLCSHHSAAILGLGKHVEVIPPRHIELILRVRPFEEPLLSAETSRECNRVVDRLLSHPGADQDLNPSVLP